MNKVITTVVFTAMQALAIGYVLMLTVGIIRGEWIHTLPTIGFRSAVVIGVFVDLLISVFKLTNSDRD
jgi:hypothetical protein